MWVHSVNAGSIVHRLIVGVLPVRHRVPIAPMTEQQSAARAVDGLLGK